MDNCSRHSKQVAGIVDMKLLAENIGDLHYETLSEFMIQLRDKLYDDSAKDREAGRKQIAEQLYLASHKTWEAFTHIRKAWEISKPFMDKTTEP